MWLYLIALVLLFVGVVGGVLSGGIFTIVLIPIGALVLLSALGHGMLARSAQDRQGASTDESRPVGRPLPTSGHENTAPPPSTPEELVDARRVQQ
jgi:hypothetical protein